MLHQKYSCRVARLTLNEYGADPIQEERLAMAMATCVFRYHQTLARKDWRWLWPLVFFEENWYVKEEGSKTPWLLSGHLRSPAGWGISKRSYNEKRCGVQHERGWAPQRLDFAECSWRIAMFVNLSKCDDKDSSQITRQTLTMMFALLATA